MEFSDNVDWLEPSATLALAARARALREEGRSIVDLSAGEPVYDTPVYASDAGIASIRAGKTGYPPTPGIPELRKAVAAYLTGSTRRSVAPEEVLVSAGVKQALFNCLFTLFGEGDEVVVPAPYWTSYLPQVRLARATPVVVQTEWADGFRLSPDALERRRTPRTRGLVLNSPGNPTGATYDLPLLREIVDWADRHGIWLLSDEIYRRLYFGAGSAPSLFDAAPDAARAVVVDGVSKTFAMPGWRIGFAVGAASLVSRAADLQSQTTSGAAMPSQFAAAAALGKEEEREATIARTLRRLEETREIAVRGLADVPGLDVRPPDGSIFLFARLDADAPPSDEVAEGLLVEQGVATVPGEAFGAPGHLRLNFAVEPDDLREGVRRIAAYFDGG